MQIRLPNVPGEELLSLQLRHQQVASWFLEGVPSDHLLDVNTHTV